MKKQDILCTEIEEIVLYFFANERPTIKTPTSLSLKDIPAIKPGQKLKQNSGNILRI